MVLDQVINFGKVTVSTGYDATATVVVLSSGDGVRLPDPTTINYNLVWYNSTDYPDPSSDPNREIVRCTGKSTDTLTVIRGQESITASTKNTGGKTYTLINAFTKKTYDDIATTVNSLAITSGKTLTITGDATISATPYTPSGTDVAVADGGTGLSTIADGSILATNTADTLSAITWHTAGTKVLTNTSGTITWENAAAGAFSPIDAAGDTTTFVVLAGAATGDQNPLTDAGLTYNATTDALTATTFVGALTGNAATVTTAAEISDTTCSIAFVTDVSGSLPLKTNTNLTFNASTGVMTAANAIAGSITGNAGTVTVVDSTSATTWPAIFDSATGSLAAKTDAGLTYNATTAALTATTFVGALTGASSSNVLKAGDTMTSTLVIDPATDVPALQIVPQNDTATTKFMIQGRNAANDANKFVVDNAGNIVTVGTVDGVELSNLNTMSTQAANNVNISGGAIAGITDLAVTDGGTGLSLTVVYTPLCGGTTSTSALQSVAAAGMATSGYVLTSNGAAALPTFQVAASGATAVVNIWLPAEAAYLPAIAPAVLTEVLGSTTYAGWSFLAYDDTTAQMAVWRVPVPAYNNGNITVTAYSKPATTPAGNVTLQYNIYTIGLADNEVFNAAVLTDTTVNISHSLTTGSLNTEVVISSAVIDPANVATDDFLCIGIERDVATDNLVGNGQLLGVLLSYVRA